MVNGSTTSTVSFDAISKSKEALLVGPSRAVEGGIGTNTDFV